MELGPEEVSECVREVGVAFMFAPRYHPAMRTVVPVRKALRVRTAFNILGPLLNPAQAKYSLVGVYSPSLVPLMAETLLKLGTEKSLVVHQVGALFPVSMCTKKSDIPRSPCQGMYTFCS